MPTHTSSSDDADVIAGYLWKGGAVQVCVEKPFVWSSGLRSPMYCDNRRLLSSVSQRADIATRLATIIKKEASDTASIAGVATAGIPYATMVADKLGRNLLYVRGKAKRHGLQSAVEGKVIPKEPVVLVEDVISTGSSCLQAAGHLMETGMVLQGIFAIFSYELPIVKENWQVFCEPIGQEIPRHTLSHFSALLEVGLHKGHIKEEERAQIISVHARLGR